MEASGEWLEQDVDRLLELLPERFLRCPFDGQFRSGIFVAALRRLKALKGFYLDKRVTARSIQRFTPSKPTLTKAKTPA